MKPAGSGVKLTYDDFVQFPDDGQRHELIDGEHYVTPSPNTKHQQISGRLHLLIGNWLEAHPLGQLFYAPYDVVISRAFSELGDFAHGAARHLAPHGVLAAMKGVHPDEELRELPPHVELIAAPSIDVPGLDAQRHLIVMRPREQA